MMKKLINITALAALLLTALLLFGCSGPAVEPGEAVAVISGDEITVSAAFTEQLQNARRDMTVYLFAVSPGISTDELLSSSPKPLAEAKMADKLSFTVPLCEDGESRLTSGFVLATYDKLKKLYDPLHDCPVYVQNPEVLASNREPLPSHSSIKGVTGDSISHAISLGASHSIVELPIEKYILLSNSPDAVRHEFGGVSYYFDRTAVESLDKRVAALTDANIEVYLRIYLGQAYETLEDEMKFLSYTGTEEGKRYYAINFGNSEAMLSYSAFVDLLCSRYAQNDPDFGRASSIIVGKAANSPDLGSEAEAMTSGAYLDRYAVALRITHNVLRSYCEHGQAYLSIDDNLYAPGAVGSMDGEDFLLSVAAVAHDQGDYEWGIAAECGSSFAGNDTVWNDTETASILTPANLSSFTKDLLEHDELTYGDVARPVIISDFAVYSAPGEPASEDNQAASYAYAYYEAVRCGKLRAFIYSDLYDTENSSYGLIGSSGEKEIYKMLRLIDTDYDLSDIVGNFIGSAWTKLYGDDALKDTVQRGKYSTGKVKLGGSESYELSPLLSFDDGSLAGFDTVSDGYVALIRKNGHSQLAAYFDPSSSDGDFAVAANGVSPDLISGDYLVLPVRIVNAGDLATDSYKLSLTLLQNEPNGDIRIYSSSVSLEANADKTAIFNISEFSKNKLGSAVTLIISLESSEGTPCTLFVGDLLSATEPNSNWLIVLLVILAVLVVGALAALFVLWFRKNYTIDLSSLKRSKTQNKNTEIKKEEEE